MGKKKTFNDRPFAYRQEIELEIATLTNLGIGLGRVALPGETEPKWVVMIPFTLPGERVRVRVFRNHKNFSEADLLEVLTPSPHRVAAPCPVFGRCGGCQYQHLEYAEQLAWKRRQVAELLQHMAGIADFPVAPVVPSPRDFGYRSKITPHFNPPRRPDDAPGPVTPAEMPIGFLRQGTRFDIVDIPQCIIATEAINARLAEVRADVRARAATGAYSRAATILLREASGSVTTDYDAIVTETVGALKLHFLARDFFQNNPFILPAFTRYVREQAAASGARFLVDAY
ncbi:MAG: TRAM domain-containing protein, partial [Opitutaceae bacterium]